MNEQHLLGGLNIAGGRSMPEEMQFLEDPTPGSALDAKK
jgi:hypothetical protein